MKYINESQFEKVADEFGRWVFAGDKVLSGLVKRRETEKQLFVS